MTRVQYGRHNDHTFSLVCCMTFFLGAVLLLLFRDYFFIPTEAYWSAFWNSEIGGAAVFLCCLPVVISLLYPAFGSLGKWLNGISFGIQGGMFAYCVYILCQSVPDLGVYMALFSIVAPAFFLVFTENCCEIPIISGRCKLMLLLIGVALTYAIRWLGHTYASGIFQG